jgi:hypothetical protein
MWEQTGLIGGLGPGSSVQVIDSSIIARCPNCGRSVTSTGSWQVTEHGWRSLARALRPPEVTAGDYRNLMGALRRASEEGSSAARVAEEVAAASPKFEGVANFLASRQGEALARWLLVLLAVLALILGADQPREFDVKITVNEHVERPSEGEIESWIRTALEEAQRAPGARGPPSPARNRACPCGSGRKYKRCCGGPRPRR